MENAYVKWLFAILLLLGLNYFLLVSWGGAFGSAVNMLSTTALEIMFMLYVDQSLGTTTTAIVG